MEFSQLVSERRSVRTFQPGHTIDDAELSAIFEQVVLSPSSFNLQHWQFVVIRDAERKAKLRQLAYGQAQVEACAAAVVVCGNLDAYKDADRLYAEESEEQRKKYVPMIQGVYEGQTALQREEAIRSGALAAMSLMYAARDAGWDTGPMIGFDASGVASMLNLEVRIVPVMMVVVGRADSAGMPPRAYRRPIGEVVHLEQFDGERL